MVEMEFYHVGQAGLELLTSSDPPASASRSAGTTGLAQGLTSDNGPSGNLTDYKWEVQYWNAFARIRGKGNTQAK